MRLTLVITGEVQVDIRLFVSLESKERLERNVKSGFFQRLAAVRADGVRHIASGTADVLFDARRIELAVMARLAVVMRAQRVYLRDSRHRRNERGTDGTTRSYEVAVLVRLPHQFLCDDVHNGVSVGNNGVQLSLEARGNDLRQLLAVDFMRAVVTDSPQCLVGILDDRREFSGTDRGDFLDKVGDFARIGDDDLLRFLTSEIRKLFKHLLGGAQEQRCLLIRVVKTFSGHDDAAVDLVLRIHEVDVARCHNRLMELLAEFNNAPVDLL